LAPRSERASPYPAEQQYVFRQPLDTVLMVRLAERNLHAKTADRLCGALDARTGQVTAQQVSHFAVAQLVRFNRLLRRTYGAGERLSFVRDNWPVHLG
jgi:hypothetical protein